MRNDRGAWLGEACGWASTAETADVLAAQTAEVPAAARETRAATEAGATAEMCATTDASAAAESRTAGVTTAAEAMLRRRDARNRK